MEIDGYFKFDITLTVGRNSLLSALQMLNVWHRSWKLRRLSIHQMYNLNKCFIILFFFDFS